MKLSTLALFTLLTMAAGCSKTETAKNSILSEENPMIQGVALTASTGIVEEASILPKDNFALLLKESSFGELLLLKSTMFESIPTVRGMALDSKLVFFLKKHKSVYLFESTALKNESTNYTDGGLLLAEFPIIEDSEEGTLIDFNKGMKEIIYESGKAEGSTTQVVSTTYVGSVELVGTNLTIEQFFKTSGNASQFGKIQYTLSSYQPSSTFKPTSASQFRKEYFFTTPTQKSSDGSEDKQIYKFDTSKVHTFYISANTPAPLRQTVIDSILYWNKAYGKEVLKWELLTAKEKVGGHGRHIIHFEDWNNAGYAYADMIADPISGEVTESNIYIPSAFITYGMGAIIKIKGKIGSTPKKDNELSLRGFNSRGIKCNLHSDEKFAALTRIRKEMSDAGESTTDIDLFTAQFVGDYFRTLVTHEIGHVLGLRHNFAGSLESDLTAENINTYLTEYRKTGKIDESVAITSSIMEYTPGQIDALTGMRIRLSAKALPYDENIIKLQSGEMHSLVFDANHHLFCTDEDLYTAVGKTDCKQFDYLKTPFETAKADMALAIEDAVVKLSSQNPSLESIFYPLILNIENFLTLSDLNSELLIVNSELGDKRLENIESYLTRDFEEKSKLVGLSTKEFVNNMKNFISFQGEINEDFNLNLTREIANQLPSHVGSVERMKNARRLLKKVESKILTYFMSTLSKKKFIHEGEEINDFLVDFITTILASQKDVGVPVFADQNLRKSALVLLTSLPLEKIIDREEVKERVLNSYKGLLDQLARNRSVLNRDAKEFLRSEEIRFEEAVRNGL